MKTFTTMSKLREAYAGLPAGDETAAAAATARQARLTKPPGSLGRLEDLVSWLARWQGTAIPRLDRVDVLVFAGNHGVVAQGVSAFPASVTAQMVANFEHGGAAINQLCGLASANLRVVALDLDRPTADFTREPALSEAEFLAALSAGFDAIDPAAGVVALGEMGIGNTTSAAALAAALFGGDGAAWVGRGTGVDDAGLRRKAEAVDQALARHRPILADPLAAAAALGGRELAAIFGAALGARRQGIPVLLDGFVSTAAAAPLARLAPDGLAHTALAHVSAEAGHRLLAEALGLSPLLDLGMRLGEASGAAVGILLLHAALVCHTGMATFDQAGVDGKI